MCKAAKKKSINFHNRRRALKYRRIKGFSLLEVLVVIAILVTVMAVVIPVLSKVRLDARTVLTMNNQRQIVTAVTCFASDNNGRFPQTVATIGRQHWNWQEPTMLASSFSRSSQLHRSLSAYLRRYIENAGVMFCQNAPREYKYLQDAWDAGDNWDNPRTPQPQDPVIGTYCFYWNYVGYLPRQNRLFRGPKIAPVGRGQSELLVSDYLGLGHWRNPNAYISCEKFKDSSVTPGTWVSSDFWSNSASDSYVSLDTLRIKLHAGFVDGHVETYSPAETVPMKVSITPDGTVPYPDVLGPGIFYLPETALQ